MVDPWSRLANTDILARFEQYNAQQQPGGWAEMFTQGQEPSPSATPTGAQTGWWDKLSPAQKTQYNMMYNAFNDGSQLIAPPVYLAMDQQQQTEATPTPAAQKQQQWGWTQDQQGEWQWNEPELESDWKDQMRDWWGYVPDDLKYRDFKNYGYEHGLRWVEGGFNPFGGTEGWSRLDKYGQPAGTNTLGDRQFRIRTR